MTFATIVTAVLLHLSITTDASNDLKCKATPDSALSSVLGDDEYPLLCITNSSDDQSSQENLERKLMAAINELSSTRSELIMLKKKVEDFNRTQENDMEQTIKRVSAQLMPSINMQVTGKVYQMNGWRRSKDFVFKVIEEKSNYQLATTKCQGYGGRLASEIARHPVAAKYILDTYGGSEDIWLGFDDIESEGIWLWSDGGDMEADTTAWNVGEPNSWQETDEDCGHIIRDSRVKLLLNDAPCSALHMFVCEIDLQHGE